MSDLDAVLERLVTDPVFAHELSRNPTEALAGSQLSREDLSTLSTQVSFDRGTGGLVEERISKAGMFALLSTMAAGVSALGGGTLGLGGPDTAPAAVGVENPTTIVDPNQTPGVIDPNQSPGGEHDYGLAVDAFTPSDVEEGPEESVGFHDVDEAPEESVGIHKVDEQPAPDDVSIHEVDQPAPQVGLVDPGDRVGFNPQPDPPGLPG